MSDINFKPLFEYLDDMKAELKADIAEVKESNAQILTNLDGLTKMVKTFQEEHIIMRKRLEVLEAWAKKVSEKVGIPLPF
ncbi:MAG: hypothetical protein A3H72_03970 [Candidatus Doudnabacteria bacterium RIFCSPLOWO2_02_FULL_48_8]|uniref:Uncharacterized protein n=1 Tax=Candidatus Doudnabacteria bacterium RIFCSPHIGHO2_01_FULL_46_24 TaxID=1817825 RepID=A0A1F5NVL3_9BACT|nr:MAG: hypothetical protein A2720_02180 [Candidatus Doudnabacteria bacterium RIFCSPHIGHO2_01_FULL_46_24]OGE95155.1 MAG: hypothetical protein A3H72_03970 [Candidatus Doudnabacteria bacterium RIFCSPLOWO2_02_FULL_48_8]OGE95538.1 MAG: hypothetical protein A3E98_01860 [Candidatus Doudnabacteria bacterium RIFCSPHIGHO2_12_FULL_48_11]